MRSYYRRVWLESVELPVSCFFCDEMIEKAQGRDADALDVHHVNGDHDNFTLKNLRGAHRSCHARHHMIGRVRSDTHKANWSAARKGHIVTEETRRKISEAHIGKPSPKGMKGKIHTAETRAKMSEASRRSWAARRG